MLLALNIKYFLWTLLFIMHLPPSYKSSSKYQVNTDRGPQSERAQTQSLWYKRPLEP